MYKYSGGINGKQMTRGVEWDGNEVRDKFGKVLCVQSSERSCVLSGVNTRVCRYGEGTTREDHNDRGPDLPVRTSRRRRELRQK